MQWLNQIVEDIISRFPEGDLLVSSGSAPSGAYHVGHLREIITCDAIVMVLQSRGRTAKHIHFVDDLDPLRKIPVNVDQSFEKYIGKPLCNIPSPGEDDGSYALFFLNDFKAAADYLNIDLEYINSHEKYRSGFFVEAIEKCLENVAKIKEILEEVSHRSLDADWRPVQIMISGYLKNKKTGELDKKNKTLTYFNDDNQSKQVKYDNGDVKLNWRLDWPARWWLLNVNAEPFGRDHATKGGSYDTGAVIAKEIFKVEPPIPVPYDFINRSGDTKKMSASKGTGVDATEVTKVLPPEVIRFFILRYPPSKRLYFDPVDGVIQLVDEFTALAAKASKTADQEMLFMVCTRGLDHRTVSRVPFSHLVTSYQAALKDADKTLDVISRTEYSEIVKQERDIIKNELVFIDEWLNKWAPESVKFSLLETLDANKFSEDTKTYFRKLSDLIEKAPENTDGNWFHDAIYEAKEGTNLELKDVFMNLYKVLIGKSAGPRAGWFLSILPREWLIKRLRLEG